MKNKQKQPFLNLSKESSGQTSGELRLRLFFLFWWSRRLWCPMGSTALPQPSWWIKCVLSLQPFSKIHFTPPALAHHSLPSCPHVLLLKFYKLLLLRQDHIFCFGKSWCNKKKIARVTEVTWQGRYRVGNANLSFLRHFTNARFSTAYAPSVLGVTEHKEPPP